MADLAGALDKKIGPLPLTGWIVIVGGVGAGWFVLKMRTPKTTTAVVDQVAVPVAVGAIASPDYAPSINQSVSYFDAAAINALTDTVTATNQAILANTGATQGNTGALGGNTVATGALTSQIVKLSDTITKLPPTAPTQPPASTVVPAPIPSTTTAVAVATKTVMVRSGDTLSGIAKRYTGNANRWRELYNANAAAIDARARKGGYTSAFYNHIWPGQVFTLPAGW